LIYAVAQKAETIYAEGFAAPRRPRRAWRAAARPKLAVSWPVRPSQ